MGYRFLPHTADVRVAIDGATFGEVLSDAVRALRTLLTGASPVAPEGTHPICIEAADGEETVLTVLREVLYLFETQRFAPAGLRILSAAPTAVSAVLDGEPFDPARHETQPEVKAVTRHGLVVRERGGQWHAEVVFDV